MQSEPSSTLIGHERTTFHSAADGGFYGPDRDSPTFSLLYQFKSGRDGPSAYSNLILDPRGNLYGSTLIDGAYSYGTVFKVTPAGKETGLHSFTGMGGDGANPVARPSSGTPPAISTASPNNGVSTVHVVRTAVEPYSKSIQPAEGPCCIVSPESLVSTG
jgi:uncharacterized repeat protein (TIGR03803 family)